MKIFILLPFALFLALQVLGQEIKITYKSNTSVDLSGTVVELTGDKSEADISAEFSVINENAEPINVVYIRNREINSGRIDQICENNQCMDADDTYSWTTPHLNTISSGEPGYFYPKIIPDGKESCAIHDYYVVDDSGEYLDSITIIFKTMNAECNLSVGKENLIENFKLFPNPAQDVITLKGDYLNKGDAVVFRDALGKEVKRTTINTTNNKIDVASLKRGVYFVNIYNQNGVKSKTQRLVKQ